MKVIHVPGNFNVDTQEGFNNLIIVINMYIFVHQLCIAAHNHVLCRNMTGTPEMVDTEILLAIIHSKRMSR